MLALREYCFPGFFEVFRLVLIHFKLVIEKSKSLYGFALQNFYGIYGIPINLYALSLVGK
jgi:hypothetical protein